MKVKWRYVQFALTVVGLTSLRVRPTPLTLSTSSMHNCASEPKDDNEERKEEKQGEKVELIIIKCNTESLA